MTYYLVSRRAAHPALGSLGNVGTRAALDREFVRTLREFVDGVKDNTLAISRKYKNSWSPAALAQRGFDWLTNYDSVGEWKNNIDNLAISIQETLTRKDAKGVPFYQRKPTAAVAILEKAKTDMIKEVKELESAVEGQTLLNLIMSMIDRLIAMLWELAKSIVRYPKVLLGGLALLVGYVALKRLTR